MAGRRTDPETQAAQANAPCAVASSPLYCRDTCIVYHNASVVQAYDQALQISAPLGTCT